MKEKTSIIARSLTSEDDHKHHEEEEESSSSSSSDMLYLCVAKGKGGCKWHVLNPISGYHFYSEAMNEEHTPLFCGCAVVGSFIYVIGGQEWIFSQPVPSKPTKCVKIFDTISQSWQDGKEMIVARSNPKVVFATDRIYVFGGSNTPLSFHPPHPQEEPWPVDLPYAEYFDLNRKEDGWLPLGNTSPPPEVIEHPCFNGHFVYGTSIILLNDDKFCLYNWLTDAWHCVKLKSDVPWVGVSTRVTVFQHLLFWYYGAHIFSFDLSGNEYIVHPSCNLDFNCQPDLNCCKMPSMPPFLVGIGDAELCLVWHDYEYGRLCRWAKFQVCQPSALKPVIAEWYHSGAFPVGGFEIHHCLSVKRQNDDANKHDCHRENEKQQIQDPVAYLNLLSRTMHRKNYFSYALIEDEIPVDSAQRSLLVEGSTSRGEESHGEVEISVDSLLQCLDLKEQWAMLYLKKILDKNALKHFKEKDIKALNIPMGHKDKLLSALGVPDLVASLGETEEKAYKEVSAL